MLKKVEDIGEVGLVGMRVRVGVGIGSWLYGIVVKVGMRDFQGNYLMIFGYLISVIVRPCQLGVFLETFYYDN